MPNYTVKLVDANGNPNGEMHVNASSQAAANDNVRAQGGTPDPNSTANVNPNTVYTNASTNAAAAANNSNNSDMSGLAQFAAQTSGVTQAQLSQQKTEFDAQLAQTERQMQLLGIPQLQINQYLATLQQQQFLTQAAQTQAGLTGYYSAPQFSPLTIGQVNSGQQTGTAAPQQTLALGQLMGSMNGAPTEAASEFARNLQLQQQQLAQQQRQFEANLGLQQGQLGQQYLATAAQLQGPQNTFQLSNYLRGAQGNQAVPTYINALMNNQGMPAFQATGSTAPTPQSAQGLLSQMGGGQAGSQPSNGQMQAYGGNPYAAQMAGENQAQNNYAGQWQNSSSYGAPQYNAQTNPSGGSNSATPGWDYNRTLGAINNIAQRGAQSLGPGSLERLSSDELSAFGSGLGAAGYSLPSFMQQYQQSRVGQQAPTGMTSLA